MLKWTINVAMIKLFTEHLAVLDSNLFRVLTLYMTSSATFAVHFEEVDFDRVTV